MGRMLLPALVIFLSLVHPAAGAPLPRVIKCNDGVCVSFASQKWDEIRDYYTYGDAGGIKQVVVRFKGGSTLNINLKLADEPSCVAGEMRLLRRNRVSVWGAGCLANFKRERFVSVTYSLVARGSSSERFFSRLDPVIWLSVDVASQLPESPIVPFKP